MCVCVFLLTVCFLSFAAIQFVLSDEFSHLRPEQRLALLHVSNDVNSAALALTSVSKHQTQPSSNKQTNNK